MQRKYVLKPQPVDTRDVKLAVGKMEAISRAMDLRDKCPPVFDQGSLGSCTANVGTAARMMLGGIDTELSRLFLYYKERELENTVSEDAGATMRSICKVLNKTGVCRESIWPYVPEKFAKAPPDMAVSEATQYKITAYKTFSDDGVADDIGQIKQYIALKRQPVLMGMSVYESFESEAVVKSGIVPIPDTGKETLLGGHAVLVVGYDDDFDYDASSEGLFGAVFTVLLGDATKGAFLVRNSWGKEWGLEGYFWLPYLFFEKKLAWDFWVIE